jgi:hypothetical protein
VDYNLGKPFKNFQLGLSGGFAAGQSMFARIFWGYSMDIFFQDPTDIPLPPGEVRIRQFRAEPWPDGQRVRITLELTPFLKRPNGEIRITDSQGAEAASISIIETMEPKMEFTMHLRGHGLRGPFTAAAYIFYLEEPEEKGEEQPQGESQEVDQPPREQMVVDSTEITFDVTREDEG